MNKESLLNYYRNIKEKINEIEDFNNKYIDNKKFIDKNKFKITEETFNDLNKKVEKYKKIIDEYHIKTNNAKAILSSHEKVLKSLNMENYLLNKKLNNNTINHKFNFPIISNTSSDWKITYSNIYSKTPKLNLNNINYNFEKEKKNHTVRNNNELINYNNYKSNSDNNINSYYRFPEYNNY